MSAQEHIQISETVFPKQNPLLISVVLENLLNQSEWSLEDLKNMRAVCKLWHDYTLPRWRSTATVCLLQQRRPSSRTKGIIAKKFVETLTEKDDPLRLQSIPFGKYKLFNWRFKGRNIDFRRTWTLFGSFIKQLTLEKCTFHGDDGNLLNFMVYPSSSSPELTHLVLNSCEKGGDWTGRRLMNTNLKIVHLEITNWVPFEASIHRWDLFLRTFPALKTLKFCEMAQETVVSRSGTERNALLRNNIFLREDLKPQHLPHLRDLDIMHWNLSPFSQLDITNPLRTLGFPLESLSLSLYSFYQIYYMERQFNSIVTAHRRTLRQLKVFVPVFHVPQRENSINVPDDLIIEELELWGNVLADLSFLLKMPMLKRLKMDFGAFEKWKFMGKAYSEKAVYPVTAEDIMKHTFQEHNRKPTEFVVMEHLTDFHIDLKFSLQEIKLIGKWMPNLRSFKSVFHTYNLRMLLRNWKNMKLRELHALYGSKLGDFAIYGFPENQNYPKISWLKELRHFSSEAYCNEGLLTDKSVEGFLKTNLCSLKISVSSEFSQDMEKRLKETIAHVQVIRNYGDHNGECCHRLLFKKKALVPRAEGVDKKEYHMLEREQLKETGSLV